MQRLVKPQLLAHHRHHLGIGLRSGNQPRRVTGQHMDEQKHQHRDDKQSRDQAQQALNHIIQHRSLPFRERGRMKMNMITASGPPVRS